MNTGEFEKQELPVVPPPAESESEFHYEPIEDPDKFRRKVKILLILVAVCVLIGILFFVNNTFNFYDMHIRKQRFDYRKGETVGKTVSEDTSELAVRLSEQIRQPLVQIQAEQSTFGLNGDYLSQITAYDYIFAADKEELSFRTGIEDWILTESGTLRRTAAGVERKKGSEWTAETEEPMPALYDYCFAAADRGQTKLAFNASYDTRVNDNDYRCEIWLMETQSSGMTFYYTLYRYYQPDGQLAAVRVLRNNQQLMYVYEIKNYTLQ